MLEHLIKVLSESELKQAYDEFKELDHTGILCDGIVR